MADIFCSFELEPRTLSQGQLNHAREVAAGEAQNLVPTELVSALFNEGVMHNPRKEAKKEVGENNNGGDEVVDENCMENKEEDKEASLKYCLCRTAITHESSHHHTHDDVNVKEPLSAPF